jgi:hypothetical protein
MKKTLLLCMSAALLGTVNAQEVYKQEAGNKNLEVQFAPLGGTPIGMGGIRLRSFSSETSALRLSIFVGGSSKSTITQQAIDTSTTTPKVPGQLELKDTESSTVISIRPGFEKHMTGTDRLSPYMGAEIDFGMKFSKEKNDAELLNVAGTENEKFTKVTKGKDGYMRFGLNLVAGTDWYFTKKAYLGVELGFGFAYTIDSKIKVEDPMAEEVAKRNNTKYVAPLDEKQGNSMNWGPTVNGQLRLGFLF